jgi:small subunit ribosomal protein S16
MSAKIRLQRQGKKGKAYFHIVVANITAPRDGKYIERLGSYNPNTNPATIEINFDSAINWLHKGAQPTDTARAILSYKGILYKHHLNKGIAKGALTAEQADEKFAKWMDEKNNKIDSKKNNLVTTKKDALTAKFKAEEEVNKKKLAVIEAKKAEAILAATPPVVVEEKVEDEPIKAEDAPVAEENTSEEAAQ